MAFVPSDSDPFHDPEPRGEGPDDPDRADLTGPDGRPLRLDVIRATGDRRAAAALTAVLLHGERLDEDTLDDVADTLASLEDLRTHAPLHAAVLDASLPRDVRLAALRVLGCLPCDDLPPTTVHAFSRDRDDVVRAYGASFLEPVDEDLLAALVADPSTLVRRAAAESLVASARTPVLVAAVRRALHDPDPLVREIACRAALFDEPVAATYDLLHLLDDLDPDVRCGVYDALDDYPSVSVMLALADARSGPEGPLAEATLGLLAARVRAVLTGADEAVERRVRRWVSPAAWLLEELRDTFGAPPRGDGDEDGDPYAGDDGEDADDDAWGLGSEDREETPERRRLPVDVIAAGRSLLDPDAAANARRDALVAHDWSASGEPGLRLLVRVATSPAWSLRHGAAVALLDLARAGDAEAVSALLSLAGDVESVVRRTALHALTHVGEPRAVPAALETLASPRLRPIAGDAALRAVAALATPRVAATAIRRELAATDDRDGLQLGAVHLAERLRLAAAVVELRGLVEAPVVCGVSVHVAALHALRSLGSPPARLRLAHLEAVDHLDVQAELGAWDWHGPRYG